LAKIETGLGKKFFKYPFYLFGSLFVLGKLVVLFRTLQTSRKNKNTHSPAHKDMKTGPFSQREIISASSDILFSLVI